ncbi:PorP/SprF family type IX secretion system membrane protein [Mucilaginibacter celer]|uniref:Type IX secretion system membrane protein PorP/SprF n=1 Tax=Mucilaginibacter celer TaxID=2305508 RepID=A0A494VSU3_9SPHI|nr:PorP/SprF family type IX secretion system membrane protein [Mucilaginibacter celer]AYL98686.1 type IX secretion system membrane protein PorP/SprF [Mucilaginibacter celer]
MKKLLLILTIALQFAAAGIVKAQVDPHFSQYYAYPLWLNPALTGAFDGDTRLSANFRDQWSNINNGYRTAGVSMDHKVNDKAAIGFNVLDQKAGTAGYNYFTAYGSFGYGIPISGDGNQRLHFGLQAGVINRSFDPGKLQSDNQYDPNTGFDPTIPNFENFGYSSATVFDAGAGIYYYNADPMNKANLFGGVSVNHLTDVKDPFASGGINSKLPMRFTAHGGIRIKASQLLDVIPNAVYIKQNKAEIKAFGIYSEFKFADDNGLVLGGMLRLQDAAIANIGYHIRRMVIGASYDFNTSGLRSVTSGVGGFELSISYIFSRYADSPAPICPRI